MRNEFGLDFLRPGPSTRLRMGSGRARLIFTALLCLTLSSVCPAVSSKVTRHNNSSDLIKGKTENVVIDSRGTIQLGRADQELVGVEDVQDVWSINSIIVSGGIVYFGTSPNGGIYKYGLDKLTKIYPLDARYSMQDTRRESGPSGVPASIAGTEINEQESSPSRAGSVSGKVPDRIDGSKDIENQESSIDDDESGSPVRPAPDRRTSTSSEGPPGEPLGPAGSNEHIFAMATDVSGRLLAGISGGKCRLCRYESNEMETIFEPNDAKYIFAITVDDSGNIYLGTGPEGNVYRLNSLGKKAQLIYDSPDKNILSLSVGREGIIYAGSDSRGLVYAINPRNGKVTVLYDSDQPEITSLLFVGPDVPNLLRDRDEPKSRSDESFIDVSDKVSGLYAAATSAEIVQDQKQFAASVYSGSSAGRPEPEEGNEISSDTSNNGRKLQIANTKAPADSKPAPGQPPPSKRAKPAKASYVYKITENGFVNEIFGETAVFFCLARQNEKLLVGTGNKSQLFSIDPAMEREAVVYEDEQSSQITAIAVAGDDVYLGTANPAKLIKLASGFASVGTYTSDLIDAGQPANWGKLQLEAEIPQGCRVQVASRSGNVKDVNDPTFSQWSEPVEVTAPVQLSCPLGRFCQYKLILRSDVDDKTPLIREIAVASTVPNLAPKVESVTIARVTTTGKQGYFKISYDTKDDNDDKLIYKIDFRRLGRTNWIKLVNQHEGGDFEWDGKSVEDGRYEIRVIASDARSNTTSTALTGSRISEPVVVDNTGPVVADVTIRSRRENGRDYKIFEVEITDTLSAIGTLEYTIDSNEDWIGTVPEDLVYDTTDENFTIKIDMEDDLLKGDHILTIKVADSVGNTTYRTIDFIKD